MMEELCYHIIDIVQNSISANSKNIKIKLKESDKEDLISIEIEDDGKGMDAETLRKVQDPFYTTKRGKKVGLGIPILKETAIHCEGSFKMESHVGKGTLVSAIFKRSNIDVPPIGKIKDTILTSIVGNGHCNIDITYENDNGIFNISTKKIKEQIGDLHITHPYVIKFLREFIDKEITNLR